MHQRRLNRMCSLVKNIIYDLVYYQHVKKKCIVLGQVRLRMSMYLNIECKFMIVLSAMLRFMVLSLRTFKTKSELIINKNVVIL